jgi:hypothetical protein
MVHNKNDLNDDSVNIDSRLKSDNRSVIEPEFTVDDDGIPYCKKQTDYDKIVAMNLKQRFPLEFEKMLTCFRCDHYKNNTCFFPKKAIEEIEEDRVDLKIRCELCGTKIHRLYSILMSMFYKEKHGVNIPVICCTCYATLEQGTFEKNSKRRMLLFGISLLTSIYFLFTYFLTIFIFNYIGILLFILPFLFWGYISVRDMKTLYYLWKGRKYYDKLMGTETKEKDEEPLREKFLDEEDKEKPPKGAFDSSGYD